MADTSYLKKVVEPYVRNELAREYGVPFRPEKVRLVSGGFHGFDAVSKDGQIIAAIKSASGKTVRGKNPSGKIKDAVAELYFLTLVSATTRILVLTNPEFHSILLRELKGRLARGLSLKLIPLPEEIQQQVEKVQSLASQEVSGAL